MPLDQALARWVDAMSSRGDREITEAAVHATVVVERCGSGAHQGEVVERFEGLDAVAAWLARTPEGTTFQVISRVVHVWVSPPGGGTARRVAECRYRVRVDDFDNEGTWRFVLSPDGRLAWLEHAPDDLPGVTGYVTGDTDTDTDTGADDADA